MSERVQQLLYEVQRAAEQDGKSALAERFRGANERKLLDLQREIAEEIAYSLGRAGKKVEHGIRILAALVTKRAETPLTHEEERLLEDEFYKQRALTERALRDLLIQREALGLLRHDDVKQRYVIPSWK